MLRRRVCCFIGAAVLLAISGSAAVNNPPVANPDNYTVNEDTTLYVGTPGVLANDTDAEGSSLTALLVTAPARGTLNFTNNGSFSYRPNTNYNGTDSFTYKARDGQSNSVPATVTITINPTNDVPLATNNSYSVSSDTALVVNAPGVLANDADADGDPLSAVLASAPAHGAFSLNADGSFTYTPAASYSGSDSFTYKASDGVTSSAPATVTIAIVPAPIVVVAPPTNKTACAGDTVAFSITATGTALTYQWFQGTNTIAGQTNSSLLLNNVSAAAAGIYRVRVTGATNSITNSATLTVNIPVTPVPLGNLVRYVGSIAIFNAATNGTGPFTFSWLKNGSAIAGQTNSTLVLSNLSAGDMADYAVVVSGACGGATSTGSLTVATCFNAVDVMLVIDRSGSMSGQPYTDARTACTNFIRSLHLTAATNDAAGLVSYNPAGTLNHTLTNNVAALEQAVSALGPATNGTCISCGILKAQEELVSTRHRTEALPVMVLLSDGVPHDFDTPSNALYNAQQAKNAGTRIFTVGLGDVDFALMSAMASSTNDFFYTTNSAQLAALFDAISTIICRPPTNIFGPSDVTVCAGSPASFNVMASGCASFSYQWRKDGIALAGETNSSLSLANVTATNAGAYSVVVSSACRTVTNSATLTVNLPATVTTPLANQASYIGSNAAFAAGITGTSLSYQWFHNGLLVSSSATLMLNNLTTNDAGDYCVIAVSAECGGPATNCATLTLLNRAPLAVNDAYTTLEDTPLTISASGVLANDSDPDANSITAVLLSNPPHGSLTLNADGSFIYTPAANFHGADSFTYRANDGDLSSAIATVNLTITSVNDPPIAQPDNYTINEDTVLNVNAPGVLANDSDIDGDTLNAVLVSGPSHGTLTLNGDGSFVYQPATNYNGSDNFIYLANDGALSSAPAIVNITILPANDKPAANPDTYTVNEDTLLVVNVPGVLANDTDIDGDPLTAVLIQQPTHGTLVLNTNGSFTYLPATNFHGVDTFNYKADDGLTSSAPTTVTITVIPVNDAPLAVNDDSYSTLEDTALNVATLTGVLINDFDVDGDLLSALLVDTTTNGLLTLNANGAFAYLPNTNFHGVDHFTYRATDGLATSAVALVTIAVLPVNDVPVANNDNYTVNEDSVLTISAPGVLVNDSDIDGDTLSAVTPSNPSHGTVVLNANGSFTYTPSANYHGPDSFTYRATDGAATSAVATVSITVLPVNDPPVVNDDSYSADEDVTLIIPATGVLGNDSDIDGDTLTAVLADGPSHGALILNADGSFIYTPATNFHGVDSFTYRASDGQTNSGIATVTIIVNPVNDAPVAVNDDAYVTVEDIPLNVPASSGVLTNDFDIDGDALIAILVSTTTNGTLTLNTNGAFVYLPSTNFHGTDHFTYRATDGIATSEVATVTITVLPANDPPIASDDSYALDEDTMLLIPVTGVLANDSDLDGDALSAVLVSGPVNGTLNLNTNGSFIYTPNADFNGTDTFIYRASDGATNSNVATVTLLVRPANDPPVTHNDGGEGYSVLEDHALFVSSPGVLANDTDIDGDVLTATLLTGPSHGVVTLNSDGSFSYAPATNYFGNDSFTYVANDGHTNSSLATVTLIVLPVNDAPSFVAGANQRVNFNAPAQTVPNWATSISAGPANEAAQTVHFIVSNNNPSLFSTQPAISANGTLTYTPVGAGFGMATVSISLQDDGGTANGGVDTSSVQTFTITLNGPPIVSIVNPTNGSVFVGTNNFTVVAEASDPDSVVTNVQIFAGTNVIGSFTNGPYFVPLTNVISGTYSFRAVAVDDLGLRATSSIVTVTVTQSPPVSALGPIVLNHQNGLFEQFARISNPTPRSFPNGVRLFITGLDSTNRVYNAMGTNNGIPYIDVLQALPSGGFVDVLIQYYVPNGRSVPNPTLIAQPLPFTIPPVPPPVLSIAGKNGTNLILRFTAATNCLYYVQSSADLANWSTVPGLMQGAGTPTQCTNSLSGGRRFFRVLLLP